MSTQVCQFRSSFINETTPIENFRKSGKFRVLGLSVKIEIFITCRGSPPYADLINFRKLVQKVAKSDPKSAQMTPQIPKSETDDGFRMSQTVCKMPYPSVIFFLLFERTFGCPITRKLGRIWRFPLVYKIPPNSKTRPNTDCLGHAIQTPGSQTVCKSRTVAKGSRTRHF